MELGDCSRRFGASLGSLALVYSFACSTPLAAQSVVHISSSVSCTECRIAVTPVARVGTEHDYFTIHTLTRTVASPAGTIYFAPLYEPGRIGVFNPLSGRTETIGRPGSGPGEFLAVVALATAGGDSVFVFEPARLTMLSEGRVLGVRPLDLRARRAITLPDGNLVVNALAAAPAAFGMPLHLVDRGGSRVRSFGEVEGDITGPFDTAEEAEAYAAGATIERSLALADNGHFWSAQRLRYELDLWTPNGNLARRIIRDAEWYPPRRHLPTRSSWEAPPDPIVVALHQDGLQRLWVATWVADSNWQPQEARNFVSSRARDTIIEVIDLRALSVISRTRLPSVVVGIHEGGMLITAEEDASGLRFLQLARAEIRQ